MSSDPGSMLVGGDRQTPQLNAKTSRLWTWRPAKEATSDSILENARSTSPKARSYKLESDVSSSELEDSEWESGQDGAAKEVERTIRQLLAALASTDKAEETATKDLAELDDLWQNRRGPFLKTLEEISEQRLVLQSRLTQAPEDKERMAERASRPASLRWVEGTWFVSLANSVIVLNMLAIVFAEHLSPSVSFVMDQLFLSFYVVELILNLMYYQKEFLIGPVGSVAWGWLDLMIVVSGVLDQWVLSLAFGSSANIGFLKYLRLFRVLRLLRILKVVLFSDMSWARSHWFDIFMLCVIVVNAVVMSLELDIEWPGWAWVNSTLLAIYLFELLVKLKDQGCKFFQCSNPEVSWNYLDFVIVGFGAFDLWLMPFINHVEKLLAPGNSQTSGGKSLHNVLMILRLLRLLRVLRLVKLLKAVPPLHRLLVGVMQALDAIKWVLVLTILLLYALAIVFRSVVGKGLLDEGGHASEDAAEYFGTVPSSVFSLFKLMNGDSSVVESTLDNMWGQLMFCLFMVIANWSILAILTSVVSDNMIAATAAAVDKDKEIELQVKNEQNQQRLMIMFEESDTNRDGTINETEWRNMMQDRVCRDEILDAANLPQATLDDLFENLADEDVHTGMKKMSHKDFMEALQNAGETADKRSVLHVMHKITLLDKQIKELRSSLVRGGR